MLWQVNREAGPRLRYCQKVARAAPGAGAQQWGKGQGKNKVAGAAHKGKSKGKGSRGQGWVQPPVPSNEMAWFMDSNCFSHWGGHDKGGFRCLYFNSTTGCHNPRCGFAHKCFVCGQDHGAMAQHNINDHQSN